MRPDRPNGGCPCPYLSRDVGGFIFGSSFVAAHFLTYPHPGMCRDSAGVCAKGEKPPILSPLIILGMDVRGPVGGMPGFVHAFQRKMTNDPVLIAYAVKRAPSSGKPVWTRIGSAYPHDTGAGLTVVLDAIPFEGRVVLLERTDEDDERLQRRLAQVAREV